MATFDIERSLDSVQVTATFDRAEFEGMSKPEAMSHIRDALLDAMGWPRLVVLLPLIAQPRRGRIANVGAFIGAVLRRDKPNAVSALTAMVSDGTLLAAEAQAIAEAFQE